MDLQNESKKVDKSAPKTQTCEECGSTAKLLKKSFIVGCPTATYECKNKHKLIVSL